MTDRTDEAPSDSMDAASTDGATDARWTASERPSVGVVEAVAAATGRDETALPQLARSIDPDALNSLLTNGGDVTVSFAYADTEVTVDSHGTVRVRTGEE